MSIERELAVSNRLGLHARAAAKLVHVTSQFESTIKISKDGDAVDAKSILGVLMLAAPHGTTVTLQVSGDDQAEAVAAVEDLFERRFDEDG